MIPVPRETPGPTIKRMIPVFGCSDAPHGHGEIICDNLRAPAENILPGEGRGFEIAQGRLWPRGIHHCMRMIGQAEVALEKANAFHLEDEPGQGRAVKLLNNFLTATSMSARPITRPSAISTWPQGLMSRCPWAERVMPA